MPLFQHHVTGVRTDQVDFFTFERKDACDECDESFFGVIFELCSHEKEKPRSEN